MNHWLFIALAYASTLAGTIGLLAASFIAMRRAEAKAAAQRDER